MNSLFELNYRRQERRLRAAERTGDPVKVAAAAEAGLASFAEFGYPDDWSRWERVLRDACFRALESRDPYA